MSSIPLPALSIRTPEPPDILQKYAQVQQIGNAQQEQQLRGLQIQGVQQDLAARKALNDAYAHSVTPDANGKPQFDPDKLQSALATGPAAYRTPEVMEGITKFAKTKIDLQAATTKLHQDTADMVGGAASAVKAAGYDPTLAHSLLDQLPQSPQLQQIRTAIDSNPAQFKQMIDSAIAAAPTQQKFAQEKEVANIRAASVEKTEMNDWLAKNPGKTPSDYQQFKVDQGIEASIKKETDPRGLRAKMNLQQSEAQIQQAVKNGSAKDAGALLAAGVVAPSEVTARANPSFLTQAVLEARKIDPSYNTQKAEADFNVAKSAGNLGFFGSAKSLTDKGGTLDQLAEAAKAIPQHQIPVFNTIDDALKAATGSGPIAKYASLLVGVSDDYSKVMGGGQGSDASRAQGFKLAAASASPEQREGAIQGIRGAVNSQINSRIGNNKVLRNMYGQQESSSDPFAKFGGVAHQ